MQDRLAMVGVPALAGLVTALVLTGPAQERPARGARARGVVTVDTAVWALRVETLAQLGGLYSSEGQRDVELILAVGDIAISSWQGVTDDNGLVEARLILEPEHRGKSRYELRLMRAGQLLSRTEIQPSRALEPVDPAARYRREGEPEIELIVPRGVLAPPFAEPAELLIRTVAPPRPEPADAQAAEPDTPVVDEDAGDSERDRLGPPMDISILPQGGRVERGELVALGCQHGLCSHRLALQITAEAPAFELDIAVHRGAQYNKWSGALNVHNGAIWLDPSKLDAGVLKLRSAAPKSQIFVSLLGESGRSWGALVPMREQGGFSDGEITLPSRIEAPASLIVAGDAYEPPSSAAWPASAAQPMVETKTLSLLADGMPAAEQREAERRARARRPAWGMVLAAGLFELFYLWRRYRLSQIKLAQHLRDQAGVDTSNLDALTQPRALTWLVLLAVALMLMFVIVAAVAAFG